MLKTFKIIIQLVLLFSIVACNKQDNDPADKKQEIGDISFEVVKMPVMTGGKDNDLVSFSFEADGSSDPYNLCEIRISFLDSAGLGTSASLQVFYAGKSEYSTLRELYDEADNLNPVTEFHRDKTISDGTSKFFFSFKALGSLQLNTVLYLESVELVFERGGKTITKIVDIKSKLLFAMELREKGQDNCHTYRIPGFVTTNSGTLIAVYDNRYDDRYDLQANIDVGMSRSTDGGETWEEMKVVMNMGIWGGKSEAENGIGDPCVLVDKGTNTIWVAAVWMHGYSGKTVFSACGPGLSPEKSSQLILVKSEDDGQSWSDPINITSQVKEEDWCVILQGPGKGITMSDGALVFPIQFKDSYNNVYSGIIYSHDHGLTWERGMGMKANTTEAQVVELVDGRLMLNARDGQNKTETGANNGRAVYTTDNMGQSWVVHSTSNSALQEPHCQASLINAGINLNGNYQQVLFFSNPNNTEKRRNFTIKASIDNGDNWPEKYQYELYEVDSYGYSCMTMVDKNNIGILYEGAGNLIFQKFPVSVLLNNE